MQAGGELRHRIGIATGPEVFRGALPRTEVQRGEEALVHLPGITTDGQGVDRLAGRVRDFPQVGGQQPTDSIVVQWQVPRWRRHVATDVGQVLGGISDLGPFPVHVARCARSVDQDVRNYEVPMNDGKPVKSVKCGRSRSDEGLDSRKETCDLDVADHVWIVVLPPGQT